MCKLTCTHTWWSSKSPIHEVLEALNNTYSGLPKMKVLNSDGLLSKHNVVITRAIDSCPDSNSIILCPLTRDGIPNKVGRTLRYTTSTSCANFCPATVVLAMWC